MPIFLYLCPDLRKNKQDKMKQKLINLPLLLLAFAGIFASCIGEEPLNAECDIEDVTVMIDNPGAVLAAGYDYSANGRTTVSSVEDSICFLIKWNTDVDMLPVSLTVTEGAQCFILQDGEYQPFRNGEEVDFSDEKVQNFRIQSQDTYWKRDYKVCFVHDEEPLFQPMDLHISFDHFALNTSDKAAEANKYYVWKEPEFGRNYAGKWATGNPGFKLSKSSAKPLEYPSVPLEGEGVNGGSCLKLETKDTGAFGAMVGMRIAAGSFFFGEFDVTSALKNALAATLFGQPFKHKPAKLSGMYKWKAGERFQDKAGNAIDRVDAPDAYCVLYRNLDAEGNFVRLDGADVLTNPNIVGLGRISGVVETDVWTPFEFDVVYTEDIDNELLANSGYSMTICFSSSIDGAYFKGAPGSTFYVDDVTLKCEY